MAESISAVGAVAAVATSRGAFRDLVIDRIPEPCDAAQQLSIEQTLFDDLIPGTRRLRLWQPLPALVATRVEANQPAFAWAAARARDRGLTVMVRGSGGGAVCLGPGSLIVSFFYCSRHNDIEDDYREFSQRLLEATASLDAALSSERVAGAYCDGRFDLAWAGRKVGGIAQRRRTWQGSTRVWVHAVLAVEARAVFYPRDVTTFYTDLGSSRIADQNATTTLSHCLSAEGASQGLLLRVGDAIVRQFVSGERDFG